MHAVNLLTADRVSMTEYNQHLCSFLAPLFAIVYAILLAPVRPRYQNGNDKSTHALCMCAVHFMYVNHSLAKVAEPITNINNSNMTLGLMLKCLNHSKSQYGIAGGSITFLIPS